MRWRTVTGSLLVCESISAAEQLLSRQPVIRDVAGLTADQVVRHDVQLTPPKCFQGNTGNGVDAGTRRPASIDRELSSCLRSAAVLIKKLPFVRLKARTEQKMGVYRPFLGLFCQSQLSVHSRLGFVKSHVHDRLQSVSCDQWCHVRRPPAHCHSPFYHSFNLFIDWIGTMHINQASM